MANGLKRDSSEIGLLLKTLKNVFKARGMPYQQIAEGLNVSETSVKRYLTGHGLTVEILERLCRIVDLRLSDLLDIAREAEAPLPPLSHADEEKLAAEPFMASLFYLIAKGHTPQSLQLDFGIDDAEMNRYLTKLDRWGLIHLFPFNRVRMRVSPLFEIERGGPLVQSFRRDILEGMFRKFSVSSKDWSFSFSKLSPASMEKARQLLREFTDALGKIGDQDRNLPRDIADYQGMFVMMSPMEIPGEKSDDRARPGRNQAA